MWSEGHGCDDDDDDDEEVGLENLLKSIIEAVLKNRPMKCVPFIADFLDASLNRRTVAQLQRDGKLAKLIMAKREKKARRLKTKANAKRQVQRGHPKTYPLGYEHYNCNEQCPFYSVAPLQQGVEDFCDELEFCDVREDIFGSGVWSMKCGGKPDNPEFMKIKHPVGYPSRTDRIIYLKRLRRAKEERHTARYNPPVRYPEGEEEEEEDDEGEEPGLQKQREDLRDEWENAVGVLYQEEGEQDEEQEEEEEEEEDRAPCVKEGEDSPGLHYIMYNCLNKLGAMNPRDKAIQTDSLLLLQRSDFGYIPAGGEVESDYRQADSTLPGYDGSSPYPLEDPALAAVDRKTGYPDQDTAIEPAGEG